MLLEQNASKVQRRRLDDTFEWINVSRMIHTSEHGDDILLGIF